MFQKTVLQEFLSVNSVVTIFKVDMKSREKQGEAHDFYEFLYITNGTHNVRVDKNVFTLSEGQMILYLPMSYHILEEKSSAQGYIVSFDSDSKNLETLANKVITLSARQKNMLFTIMETGEKCFEEYMVSEGNCGMRFKKDADIFELHNLKSQLELFLIDIYSVEKSKRENLCPSNYQNYRSEIFEKAVLYMKNNINRKLTITEISEHCLVSPYQIKDIFREKQKMSPIAYFISLKIEKAKKLIDNSSMNYTQISEVLGFSTVHYFSRIFKNKVGLSPKEYAKKHSI